ncbi:MAG TPA: Stf0 family sulfotransferase [Anaerolineales bacterium]|nr:Stf0 family sulfotransferase [Anaerolineales bacterium]
MKPTLSYTIWFSQRTGSTLLCKALESIRIAGNPGEWLLNLFKTEYSNAIEDPAQLQQALWKLGSTPNRIFGLKHSFHEPHFSQLLETFRKFPGCPPQEENRAKIWENAFPNHRHIFMTRRNKVRLAVSWWRAIKTQEWHRQPGAGTKSYDADSGYSFDAIHHLYRECSMREAGIQEFFSEGKVVPLTLVYEDFVQEYEKTVRKILDFLGMETGHLDIPAPALARTADHVSEEWVQRFRAELQVGWTHQGW